MGVQRTTTSCGVTHQGGHGIIPFSSTILRRATNFSSFGVKQLCLREFLFKQGMSGVGGSCLKNEDLWQHPTTDFHLQLELIRYRARPIQAPHHLQVQGTHRREVTSTSKRLDCNLQLGWKKGLRKSIASILSI